MSTLFLTCMLITTFCYGKTREYIPSSYELQLEIADLKHQIRTFEVDMQLMEEKIDAQKTPVFIECKELQSRMQMQENTIDKLSSEIKNLKKDIEQLLEHLNKMNTQLIAHEKGLQNVSELKNTLADLLKKIHPSTTKTRVKSYKVRAGDSLEKIARLHHVSVEELKANNKLIKDTIFPGQELKIPHDTE
ncbi:MAG: LysM peptidoglycan-binding domain-containing protein [Candidatus Rhabdochlamydia oedothoracis]|nr:LysM peptidoglycan-binding domain-containing protein [Candidatus Rhabdochlamydia oedothoracis]